MNTQQIFISNLKSYRKQRGFTQAQLATLIDKSFNYINGIECGASFPPPDVIDKISEVLQIKPINLFDEYGCESNIVNSSKEEFIKAVTEKLYNQLKMDLKIDIQKGIEKVLNEKY